MNKLDMFELSEQINSLNKEEEETLAMCFYIFEPYRKELENQINALKGIREPLQDFTPVGQKKETHETFRFTYNRISSMIHSLVILKRNLNLNIAKVTIPFILSPNVSNDQMKLKEYKEDLLGIARQLITVIELLQIQICKESREKNKEVFWVIYRQLKIVLTDLCRVMEETDKCIEENSKLMIKKAI